MQRAQIFLLRHGECEGGDILRGRTDVALTPQGRAQMRAALATISGASGAQGADAGLTLYGSPLRRCADFARELAADRDWPLTELAGLRELDFGDWDGQSWEQLYRTQAGALDAYWQDPWAAAPPGGESMAAFEARVDAAFASVLARLRRQTEAAEPTALLLTHGGVIRHLMARVLGVPPCAGFYNSLALPYGALVRVEVFWACDGDIDGGGESSDAGQEACSYRLHWPGATNPPCLFM